VLVNPPRDHAGVFVMRNDCTTQELIKRADAIHRRMSAEHRELLQFIAEADRP
jgi:hypothetical protein